MILQIISQLFWSNTRTVHANLGHLPWIAVWDRKGDTNVCISRRVRAIILHSQASGPSVAFAVLLLSCSFSILRRVEFLFLIRSQFFVANLFFFFIFIIFLLLIPVCFSHRSRVRTRRQIKVWWFLLKQTLSLPPCLLELRLLYFKVVLWLPAIRF